MITTYFFERFCVNLVRFKKMDHWIRGSENKVLYIKTKVKGVLKPYRENKTESYSEVSVVDVNFKLVTPNNYKRVYIEIPNESMYNTVINQDVKDYCKKDDYWRQKLTIKNHIENANHDSCWTEGFDLQDIFKEVLDFEIIEIGVKQINTTKDVYEYLPELIEGISSNVELIEKFELNVSSKNELEMEEKTIQTLLKYGNVELSFYKYKNKRSYEKRVEVIKENEKLIAVYIKEKKKDGVKICEVNSIPFSISKLKTIFPEYSINYIGDSFMKNKKDIEGYGRFKEYKFEYIDHIGGGNEKI